MTSRRVRIKNRLGLHARPAVLFVRASGACSSDIKIQKDDIVVDGKSIMGILMLEAGIGTELIITCIGDDEETALQKLIDLVEDGFGED